MKQNNKRFFNRLVAVLLTVCMMITMVGVPKASAATIKLNKKTATVTVGKTVQLKVSGTKKKVTWTSSKKSVATVSKTGKVTGKKAGSATITAKVAGKKLTCKVTVKAKSVKQTNNLKDNNKYTSDSHQQVFVSKGKSFTVKYYKNGKAYAKSQTKYESMNTDIATVSSSGKITGVSVGNTIVVADIAGVSYDIYVTVEKPIAYDFSGVTQTAWHKDWIQGVNWQQVDQHEGESFTCKLLNTSQKVKWTGKVIAAHKPTNPVKSTDEIINGSKKGVLSGEGSTNKIVFNGEGSDYITVEVTATTSDNQKKKFYIFYNDKDGSSSIATGPRWNNYITLEQYQKATYDAIKAVYPDAICIEEKDAHFNYGIYSEGILYDDIDKQEAFQQYDDKWVIPGHTGVFQIKNGKRIGSTITGYLTAPVDIDYSTGLSKDNRLKEIHDDGGIPVIYVTWFPNDLLKKGEKATDIEGCLFFDGTFTYGFYGEQIADMYYAISSTSKQ